MQDYWFLILFYFAGDVFEWVGGDIRCDRTSRVHQGDGATLQAAS